MKNQNRIKILINTLPVNYASGGIKSFLLELITEFDKRKNEYLEYHLVCSVSNKDIFNGFEDSAYIKKLIVNVDNNNPFKRIFFEQFKLNRLLKNEGKAILLNICNIAVLRCNIPQVTIIQAPLSISSLRQTLPEKYISLSIFQKIYYDLLLKKSINISARTVAVSNYMRNFLGKHKSKTDVISEGVNIKHFSDTANTSLDMLPVSYILTVSTLFPYKNMDKAIEAYSVFRRKDNRFKLVIAGKDPDNTQLNYLKNVAKKCNVENEVIFAGRIPYEQVPLLYKNASLFLYLSSVETFGLPVLEAMAAKVPVIASDKMSIPEIVNNAGILVNPDDIETIAQQMELVLTSESKKAELINKGIENANQFSWSLTASKFEDLFMEVEKAGFN